ncbi:MAG TPA: DUF2815 family protein [Rhodoglobus sp.]|nr:DUF2815 family protein [Rhodoglobus sp.]
MADRNALHVVTGPVRLSYVNVMRPKANTNDDGSPAEPTYSVMMIIPKTDKATIAAIRRAQQAALADGAARGTFQGGAPKAWKNTLRDGDVEGETPELEGAYFMNVSSKSKPGVVDRRVQPIIDETEIYSGMWARVDIGAFAYNQKGNKGVSFGLNHIQKVRDDERLDGATRAEDVFDVWEDEGDEDDSLI